jgi:hypothetical protein
MSERALLAQVTRSHRLTWFARKPGRGAGPAFRGGLRGGLSARVLHQPAGLMRLALVDAIGLSAVDWGRRDRVQLREEGA